MNPYWIIIAFSTCVQFFIFLRWLHRRTRDDEIRRALRQIAGRLGLELKEPPPVQFLEFNGHDPKS